jgi:hypothetical protein
LAQRCKLAHAFLWEYKYKELKLAQLLGQLGIFLASKGAVALPFQKPRRLSCCRIRYEMAGQWYNATVRSNATASPSASFFAGPGDRPLRKPPELCKQRVCQSNADASTALVSTMISAFNMMTSACAA